MTEREAELEAACGVMRAALRAFASFADEAGGDAIPDEAAVDIVCMGDLRDARAALAPSAGARAAAILSAYPEFCAAALAEEAETGDDEAHRQAWDRYMAAKRALIAAGETP